ncbi:hypothetical protein F5Y19DRAFT_447224 [Xylariaceae sp. FL1651]|nr:hypothetical protein F5Y19DRAFT_447224 [Xylariaceae sp. FL1651]
MPSGKPQQDEVIVKILDRMPGRYIFVPSGDQYITAHCRRQTHEAGQKVYIVQDSHNKAIGLRVPLLIYENVLAEHDRTKDARARATARRDAKLEQGFRDAVLALFPGVPTDELEKIVKWTTKKGANRVGRRGKLDMAERAANAVHAYVRHNHTQYDRCLREGTDRDTARSIISSTVEKLVRSWGFTGTGSARSRSEPASSSRSNHPPKMNNAPGPRDAGVSKNRRGGGANPTKRGKKYNYRKSQSAERRRKKCAMRRARLSDHNCQGTLLANEGGESAVSTSLQRREDCRSQTPASSFTDSALLPSALAGLSVAAAGNTHAFDDNEYYAVSDRGLNWSLNCGEGDRNNFDDDL